MFIPTGKPLSSRIVRNSLSCLLLGLAAAGAQAVEVHGYAGGGVGGRIRGPLAEAHQDNVLGLDGSDSSYRFFGGAEFGRHLAAEAAYFRAGEQRLSPALDFGFAVDLDGYSAALLAKLPFQRFVAFAKAGALHWEESGDVVTLVGTDRNYSRDNEELLVGAGITFELHRRLLLRAEWEHFELGGSGGGSGFLAAEDSPRDQGWLSAVVRFP
jgi:Outer membrane protein beta-barrel domain